MMDRETWVVWLVNRKAARLMIGTPDRLDEVDDLEDLVHGKHSQGGWSQARYQRSVEQDVDNHLKHAAERLTALRTLRRFDSIVIGTEDEMRMRVLEALPAELKDRVAGTIDVDIENSKPEDIVAKVRDLAERIDAQRERKAIEKLAELLGKSGRAREGIAGVMFALNEHAVDTLLYDPKARPSGTHCPSCGVLDPQAAECPIDGTTMARHENILDVVIDTTVAQSGDPLPIRHHLLDVKDGIAALTRF
jgi:peptide chain release factor subunit 1